MCVLLVYSQAISLPYLRTVRGGKEQNTLDLGPFHLRVIVHIELLIEKSDLLIASSAPFVHATLDGAEWERPEVMYAVWSYAAMPDFPDLKGLSMAFLIGALETWRRFTTEYQKDAAQRRLATMEPTNDRNEGKLGELRVGKRKAPNQSLNSFNAKKMYKCNGTSAHIRKHVGQPDGQAYLCKESRRILASGDERKRRLEQAEHDAKVSKLKKGEAAVRLEKKVMKFAVVNGVTPIQRIEVTEKLMVTEMDAQIEWHGLHDMTIKKSHYKNKAAKLGALRGFVEKMIASGGYQTVATVEESSMASGSGQDVRMGHETETDCEIEE
ncbi:hypothetical protein C8J56DRAFT_1060764 [Mycena floridula]|nr:hypothetical protein C8J56DRAFT_1060764 [Mycena floridula]